MTHEKPARLEIQTISPADRHGTARDLGTAGAGSSLMPPAIEDSAPAGGVFRALHAAQGPRLGVPQMREERAIALMRVLSITAAVLGCGLIHLRACIVSYVSGAALAGLPAGRAAARQALA